MLDRADGPSLRTGFWQHAQKQPDAPAVVVRGATKSYGELEHNARSWANAILSMCDSRPQRVGIFAYRSEVSYTSTLAALFAGAAFVPLNPTFPPEKTRLMVEHGSLDAIIVDKTCAPQLSQVLKGLAAPPLLMPEFDSPSFPDVEAHILDRGALLNTPPVVNPPAILPDDIAYILFTSGSTGAPKGVPVTHSNAVYFMQVMSERYNIRPGDRLSQTFDQTFDLSVFDQFMTWTNGACLYSMSSVELLAPTRFINKNELTVWFSVPSLPAQMMRRKTLTPDSMPTLRWSLFCGEPLPARTAQAWQEAAPNSIVENLYGPTELTIACFLHRWDPRTSPDLCRNEVVPIGVPYPGLGAVLVDDDLKPVAEGEAGELCVTGPQTTPGYWRDPAKTAERYVNLPVSAYETRRFYRTGDRVQRLPAGEYVFLGRADSQIKVLGHRIELGEIEAALRKHPTVEHAIAVGWPMNAGSADGIVAFVSGDSVDTTALITLAKSSLPPYAVPQQVRIIEQMPLNANGKVDRRALQESLTAASGSGA